MTQDVPFPNHRFDFADRVFVQPLGFTGTVTGILHRDPDWYYLVELTELTPLWWSENQLAFVPVDCCGYLPAPAPENSP